MSSTPGPLTATVLLTAASSSLFLAGCGGGTVSTTHVPSVSPDSTPAAPDIDIATTSPAPTQRPQSQCCWSAWGNHYECGNYPEGGNGGLCNNDVTKVCDRISNCSDLVPPSTSPPPPTTTPTFYQTTTTTLPEGACAKTGSSGCLNGQKFFFDEHFVCGKGANVDLYRWGQSSCCAQGLTYDPHNDFCCNNGLNHHSDGQCHEFDPDDDPVGCRCPSSSSLVTEVTEVAVGAEDTVIIDTQDWQNPAESPCFFAEGTMGCLNGFLFDPASDLLCGQYIVKGDTHGCCPTHDGIKTYNLQTESCCQFGDTGDVRPGAHRCQCREWPNPHCAGSLFSTVV